VFNNVSIPYGALSPGAAATGTMGKNAPNLVFLNLPRSFLILAYNVGSSTPPLGNISTLFIAIINLSIRISPKTIHSAVYVYINFYESIISIIKSIILAPPIIVFIKLACPGQSTKVNYR
jgi:hypothetical protein